MDFTIALLQRLEEKEEEGSDQQSLAQLVEAAYKVSLKQWHGWISSAACKVRNHSFFFSQQFFSLAKTNKVDIHIFYYFAKTDRNEAHPREEDLCRLACREGPELRCSKGRDRETRPAAPAISCRHPRHAGQHHLPISIPECIF